MATVDEILTRQAYAAGDETWTKDNNYPSYTMYAEPEYAPVTNKRIADFNDQVSVRGEQNAQFVGFQLPRYDDAMDLTKQNLYIHYQTVYGGSDGVPCNVSWSDNYVRMCWMIPGQATQQPEAIQMMIYATGTNSVGDRTVWKTLPATYTIHDGLEIGGGIPEPDQSWYEQFVQQMEGKVFTAQGYANDAQASKVAAAGSATAAAQSADASAQALQENKDYVESQKETFVGYNKRETDLKYANALIGSASGTGRVTVGDAWEAPIPDLRISGESEQVSTTGAQLLQDSNIYPGFLTNANGTRTNDNNYRTVWLSLPIGTYTLSVPGEAMIVKTVIDGILNNSSTSIADGAGYTCTLTQEGFLGISFRKQDSSDYVTDPQVMLNTGSTAKPWEPYTGGKPSPSPDYPQPIISTGTVTTGAQLFDIPNSIKTENGITAKCENGVITISGTPINQSGHIGFTVGTTSISPGIYTLSLDNKIVGIGMSVPSKPTGIIHLTMDTINKDISGVVEEEYSGVVYLNVDNTKGPINYTGKPMLNTGSTPKPWEPYTGGKPSPSEEYPQPLEVTVTGDQLFDASRIPNKSTDGATVTNNGDGSFTVAGSGALQGNFGNTISLTHEETMALIKSERTFTVYSNVSVYPYFFFNFYDKNGTVKTLQLTGVTKVTESIPNAVDMNTLYIKFGYYGMAGEAIVSGTQKVMVNAGSTALPWQPYQSKAATIALTEPLHGIGEYRDRITMTKRIDRCVELTFDGSEDWRVRSWSRPTTSGFYALGGLPEKMRARPGLCNQGTVTPGETEGVINQIWLGSSPTYGSVDLYVMNNSFYNAEADDKGLAAWKAHLASHPLKIVTYLDTPVETDLPAATQSALNALTTFTGTTHITITAGGPEPDVAVEYVQDTKAVIADLQAQINEIRNGGTT